MFRAAAARLSVPFLFPARQTVSPRFPLRTRLIALAFGALPSAALAATFTWTMGDFTPGVTAPSPLPAAPRASEVCSG